MSESLNKPPAEPKLASTAKRAHIPYATPFRSWRDHFAAERRWFAETFARDKMIDMFKQLAWVVPLTLLIWIYAEREQVTKEQNETIPFELVSTDPNNRLVTLRPPQDSNVVVELEGPRARVQDVLHRLRGGAFPQGLRIEIDKAMLPNRDHQLRTISLIANHELFRNNGITVTRTQPDTITVTVDEIVERDANVVPAPGTPNLGEGTKFSPAVVKLRGPRNVLSPDGSPTPLVAYAHVPANVLAQPGQRAEGGLELSLPPPLATDTRVSITPSRVDAVLQVRASDAKWEMRAMTVRLDVDKGVTDKFTVEYEPSIYDVTLVGPKDIIDQLSAGTANITPYAQLKVTSEDAERGQQQRAVRFVDLPDGVKVDEKDRQRTVPFQLVRKADAAQ